MGASAVSCTWATDKLRKINKNLSLPESPDTKNHDQKIEATSQTLKTLPRLQSAYLAISTELNCRVRNRRVVSGMEKLENENEKPLPSERMSKI